MDSSTGPEPNPRKLEDFDSELDAIDAIRAERLVRLEPIAPETLQLRLHQADWHLRGLMYHVRRIRSLYAPSTKNVGDMAAGDAAGNILVTASPAMLELMFEFYAFISLARVTLDQLQRYAAPALALEPSQRPSSITDILRWETNFPVYEEIQRQRGLVQYLIDIRDCIVHDRTFATSEGMVAVQEGFPEDQVPDMPVRWARPVVRTYFRRLGGNKVSVNICLPDQIYVHSATGKRLVSEFTYGKVNLLTQCREFAALCTNAVTLALTFAAIGDKYELRKP